MFPVQNSITIHHSELVVPHDFIAKIFVPDNSIKLTLYVMASVPVTMNKKTSCFFNNRFIS